MKRTTRWSSLLWTGCVLVLLQTSAFADSIADRIVSEFNNLNGTGVGYLFNFSPSYGKNGSQAFVGESKLQAIAGSNMANTSAYAGTTSGSNYFQSFCVEPEAEIGTWPNENEGWLVKTDLATGTSQGKTLNLGLAWLYANFANGTLTGYDYTNTAARNSDAATLQDAIWYLLGYNNGNEYSSYMYNSATSLSNNEFLVLMQSQVANWSDTYNPNQDYAVMNGARVFVMQTRRADTLSNKYYQQDFLYVANGDTGVPEPASVLLWILGSCGAMGTAWRKRRMTQIA